jgi:cytochrome c biogenesis protein CcmG/thiol:disulfide interchange protein DsbE
MKRRAALLVSLLLLGLFFMLRFQPDSALQPGRLLPAIEAELAPSGRFDLAAYRGEVVVLNFWASWCAPCRQEAPLLSRMQQPGVRVVGLSVDGSPLAAVAAKAAAFGMRFPVGRAAPELVERLGVRSVPTTCVIAPDGVLAAVHHGLVPEEELRATIAAARK